MKDSLYPYTAYSEGLYRVYASVFSVIVAFVIFGFCVWWLRKERIRSHAEEEQEKLDRLAALKAQGLAGEGLCIVCERARATEKLPRIEASFFDKDPFGFRRLHALTPMYVVKDDDGPGNQVCLPCKRSLQRDKEHKLQASRLRIAEVNAEVEADIARFESGGALADARERAQRSRLQLERMGEPDIPRLPPATRESLSDAIVTLPPAPQNGKSATSEA